MSDPLYCEPKDLHAFGLPRGAVPNPGRLLSGVSTSANTLTLDVHGFAEDDEFRVRVEAGGSLPGGLAEGVTYFALPIDESSFKARATAGGSVIDITSSGDPERVLVIAPLPVLSWIRWASRIVDDLLPAHVVPLVAPYPEMVILTTAELAAGKGLGFGGTTSRTLTKAVDAAEKRLERWGKGIPIRNATGQVPANLAASATAPYRDGRGWNRYGGT